MIFISLGSREYQFNRLLKKVDELVSKGEINERVFAQIGKSTYIPQNFEYKRYLSVDSFRSKQDEANIIISHGGTGALVSALKKGKSVIAAPRLSKYGEHIDDHQIQVSKVLEDEGYLRCVYDMEDLINTIRITRKNPINKIYNQPSSIQEIINEFINNS